MRKNWKRKYKALNRAVLETSAKPCQICKTRGKCGKEKWVSYLDYENCFEFDEDRFSSSRIGE